MRVIVVARGRLAEERPAPEGPLDLPDGSVSADVARACGIDPRACVVVVNGVAVRPGTAISDGDRVMLYPAQPGG